MADESLSWAFGRRCKSGNQENALIGHRRLSESNLNGPLCENTILSLKSMGNACSRDRRWQSEADTVNPYPEVEANAIDDELSEGVLTKIWSVRGFGQAWHWLHEKRKVESMPLNAYLTYITLPWSAILDDLLPERPRRSILTFDLNAPDMKNAREG
ncbi:unnamed protein product [Dracunculus medinensis]|uniref:Uncharacterized protein n=1 Tax=Dracunculus medinensis TaxID=318479 RepID=A0A0N4UH13_DRAME|nr:unnamed protein product [Dracunculus medinensis]